MKAVLIAVTAAAALSAAVPAFAASQGTRDRYQASHEQTFNNSGLSEHCQQVLNNPDIWGEKEVTFCQNSL